MRRKAGQNLNAKSEELKTLPGNAQLPSEQGRNTIDTNNATQNK